jgi:hypothetical protein
MYSGIFRLLHVLIYTNAIIWNKSYLILPIAGNVYDVKFIRELLSKCASGICSVVNIKEYLNITNICCKIL